MSPKSLFLTLCLSFLCLSMTLFAGMSRLPLAQFSAHENAVQISTTAAPSFAPAELQFEAALLAFHQSAALESVTFRAPHHQWDLWSQALQRTRQLLWMFTRQSQTLRQGVQLA